MSDGAAILAGMCLIELSAFVAAPLGGMTLAQMGAEVIRIDPPGGGLDYRRWPISADGTSLFWAGLNKSKKSVAIDIATDAGREIVQALLVGSGEQGGMLLTNFPARGWLSFDRLKALRPDLIQLTIMGDRHGGSAVDYTVNPKMGLPYLTGTGNDDAVVNHVLPAWDLITGQLAAVGLLAAERHRRLTEAGQHITLALEDVALAVMAHLGFVAEAQFGGERQRCGNDLFGAFGRDFVTADGKRIMVVGLTLKQWRALCQATGITAAVAALGERLGIDLDHEGERFVARNEIAALVGSWIVARNAVDVAAVFDEAGVCWGRYQQVADLVRSEACSPANPMFTTIDQPGVGPVLAPSIPLTFGTGRLAARAAPALGADTEQVLSEWLHLTSADIGRLHDRGTIGVAPRSSPAAM